LLEKKNKYYSLKVSFSLLTKNNAFNLSFFHLTISITYAQNTLFTFFDSRRLKWLFLPTRWGLSILMDYEKMKSKTISNNKEPRLNEQYPA
jgi:hypothetical protein